MLYIVSTPIGNLGDITLRALEVLRSVDLIACEDTRHTRILLEHYDIKKEMISYHQHSGRLKTDKVISFLKGGKNIALVTDAGTPGVSDPGQRLISEVIKSKIAITVLPGPSALMAALPLSGFPSSEFSFFGFLPHKKGRQKALSSLAKEERTVVLYESVHRIKKLLKELGEVIPDREIFVGREITKKFEEVYRGKASDIINSVKEKGEFVLIIKGEK